MKSRQPPPSSPSPSPSPESEESWTVDCPCGVNYDDGEEMVDCDECGVWVHTGCCHILKGHTSYVCDKCKFKKNKESEVAQVLVELPSNTSSLEDKVFELSREERAHVQGIPGGDPSFFIGVSPVFSRQLWKHTGYVPKVFQFNYSDLPQEKSGACVLFAEYVDMRTESPTFEFGKGDHQTEDRKLVNADLPPLGEAHVENYYFSKEKHSKLDSGKETKHGLVEKQEDFVESHYHSKVRRDEHSQNVPTSKKRCKSFCLEDCGGNPRRSNDEALIPLRSPRTASRNLKVYPSSKCVEDADASAGTTYTHNTKVEELGSKSSVGFNSKDVGVTTDGSFRKQLATKAARKVAPVSCDHNGQDGYNGRHCISDTPSHKENHYARREQDAAVHSKFFGNQVDGDTPESGDRFGSSCWIDGKAGSTGHTRITSADVKETSPRARLNLNARNKDQPGETLLEQYPPALTKKIFRQKNGDELHGKVVRGADGSGVDVECQSHSDSFGATDIDDGERRRSTDRSLTVPGLIEDVLNKKGTNVSYELICEEVLFHWSNLRKHHTQLYAYTSHRQAVLDCLRNRPAWSHLIDRGPEGVVGRKRRPDECAATCQSENVEQSSHLHDRGGKTPEVDVCETWPLSDSNKEADLIFPEEVPKGKRKARHGRRLTPQSRGPGARAHHGRGERLGESAQGMDDDANDMVSPFSEEPAGSSEDGEVFTHHGVGRRYSRHRGSSIDSDNAEVDL